MKIVIDDKGIETEVAADTTVKTINGIHYLLTTEDKSELASKELEWISKRNNRSLQECYQKRTANVANGGYGTYGEQFDIIFRDGIVGWETHIQNVKNNNPKPNEI